MTRQQAKKRQITVAQRGNIVQRVLVDGWSIEQAAATFGIAERRIAGWVAAYRRHGMASLRDDAAFERAPRRWWWLLRLMGARLAARLRGGPDGQPARSIRLARRDGSANPPDGRGWHSRRN
jgi:helix-turn-helix protein